MKNKKQRDAHMTEEMFSMMKDMQAGIKRLEQGQFQHSVAILELKEDVARVEKRGDETHALLEKVVKKVSDHDDEIKANLGLYDQHEKRLTTVETHLRLA